MYGETRRKLDENRNIFFQHNVQTFQKCRLLVTAIVVQIWLP